jgi:hypothetical protein
LHTKDKEGRLVLQESMNVLRCTSSRCRANFWNRDVSAARNILELLSARLLGFERIPAFARSCPAVKATRAARYSQPTTRNIRIILDKFEDEKLSTD